MKSRWSTRDIALGVLGSVVLILFIAVSLKTISHRIDDAVDWRAIDEIVSMNLADILVLSSLILLVLVVLMSLILLLGRWLN